MSSHKIDNSQEGFVLESVSLRAIWITALLITALVLVSWVLVGLMANWEQMGKAFAHFRGAPVRPLAEKMPPYMGKPALQVDEIKDYQDYLKAERKKLETYGWVDKATGKVHIPVEKAIEELARRGLPARKAQ